MFSPLVSCLLRDEAPPPDLVRCLAALGPAQWTGTLAELRGEGLLWRMDEWGARHIPGQWNGETRTQWQDMQRHVEHAQSFMLACLERLLEEARNRRVPLVVLKGAWLAQEVYAAERMRTISDIDVLCREEDVERIAELAGTLGFERPPAAYWNWLRKSYFNVPLSMAGRRRFYLDLHWNVASIRHDVYAVELWRRSRPWKSEYARTLCPEHAMIHLALHALENAFCLPAGHWMDFEALARRFVLDENLLWQEAEAMGCGNVLYGTLHLASRFTGGEFLKRLAAASAISPLVRERLQERMERSRYDRRAVSLPKRLGWLMVTADSPAKMGGRLAAESLRKIRHGREPQHLLEQWKVQWQ